jgi:hypothetical protein
MDPDAALTVVLCLHVAMQAAFLWAFTGPLNL